MEIKNKKGFAGILVSIIISAAIIIFMYYLWQKSAVSNLQKTTEQAARDAGVNVDVEDASPSGQIKAVHDLVNKVQDKENDEIEKELK